MPDPLGPAQAAHTAGRAAEALAAYQALAEDAALPAASRAQALHGIAVLRAPAEPEAAVALLRQALALHPGLAQAGEHLGTLLDALGRQREAIAAWRAALAAEPAHPVLWRRLGRLLRTTPAAEGGNTGQAVAACRHAIAAARHAGAAEAAAIHREMGLALLANDRPGPAISALLRARALDPALPDTAAPLGAALLAGGAPARAIPVLRAALAEHPGDRASLAALARALLAEGESGTALAALRRGLALSPGDPGLLALLARALLAEARPGAALAALGPALAAAPPAEVPGPCPSAETLCAGGLALAALGRPVEALARFTAALAQAPDDAETRYHAGLARLTQGDFAGGWPGFALRHHAERHPPAETRLRQPRWTGAQNPAGQRILLYAEHSVEDTLQFLRYLPMLAGLGAHIQLRVQPELHRLAAAMPALAANPDLVLLAPGAAPAPFDLRCALADLPAAFATTLPTVPCVVPYLAAPADALARWVQALPDETPRIALCGTEAALAAGFGARLPGVALHPLRLEDHDMAELAAALCRMDLVIAADGPLPHLAGALARPCFALLPEPAGWRWLIGRGDSPWYPTMRLFRGAAGVDEIIQEARKHFFL